MLKMEQALPWPGFSCFYKVSQKPVQIRSPSMSQQSNSSCPTSGLPLVGLQLWELQQGYYRGNPCCLMQKAFEMLKELPGGSCVASTRLNNRYSTKAPSGHEDSRNHVASFKYVISDFSKTSHVLNISDQS